MIKEQLSRQENQRKLFEKLLFMTIRPEFNDGAVIEAVSIVLFKSISFFGGSGGFVSVFRWFRSTVSVVSAVRWFCFDGFVSVFRVLAGADLGVGRGGRGSPFC